MIRKMTSMIAKGLLTVLSLNPVLARATSSATASLAEGSNYCVGIRGNGENVAAHWAAMGRMVEHLGLPRTAAGGSSASVTLFLLESVAMNTLLQEVAREKYPNDLKAQKQFLFKAQGLLFKSMPDYILNLFHAQGIASAYKFMEQIMASQSKAKDGFWGAVEAAKNYQDVLGAFSKYMPFANPDMLEGLLPWGSKESDQWLIQKFFSAELREKKKRFDFYKKHLMKGIEVFGKFNAATDTAMFVRPGLVDFRYFAIWLGPIGDFYAGRFSADKNVNLDLERRMKNFVSDCAEESFGKDWYSKEVQKCKSDFNLIVDSHSRQSMNQFPHQRLFERVGARLNLFPTTSVILGNKDDASSAVGRYHSLLEKFRAADDSADLGGFRLNFEKDLRYGYWGPSESALTQMQKGLTKFINEGDQKSKSFMSLGPAIWFDVLATSPAEPGLSNFQKIPTGNNREKVLSSLNRSASERWKDLDYRSEMSAGGWSDLHPTMVLRAVGCENVVYLTRQNGDSVFGQQVFIKLMGLESKIPFWQQIGNKSGVNLQKDGEFVEGTFIEKSTTASGSNRLGFNVKGTEAEGTYWDRGSNLGNVKSSFNNSIKAADIVYCTDWDNYNMFDLKQTDMVRQAYGAPIFVKENGRLILSTEDAQTIKRGKASAFRARFVLNHIPQIKDIKTEFPGCIHPDQRK